MVYFERNFQEKKDGQYREKETGVPTAHFWVQDVFSCCDYQVCSSVVYFQNKKATCCGNVNSTAKIRAFPANMWVIQVICSRPRPSVWQLTQLLRDWSTAQKQKPSPSPERKTSPFHITSGAPIFLCMQIHMLFLALFISPSPTHTDLFFSSSLTPSSLCVPNSLLTTYVFWATSDSVSGLNVLLLRQYTY